MVYHEKLKAEAYDEYVKEKGQVDTVVQKMIQEDQQTMALTRMK